MATNIDQLFTTASLLTLQGSAAACYLIPNGLGKVIPALTDIARLRLALSMAIFLQVGAAFTIEDPNLWTWVVAVINGFLIFGTAVGLNETTAPKTATATIPADGTGTHVGGTPPSPPSGSGSGGRYASTLVTDVDMKLDADRSTSRFAASWFPRQIS